MKRKIKFLLFYVILIFIVVMAFLLVRNSLSNIPKVKEKNVAVEENKVQGNNNESKITKEEIYEYGKKIEEADIAPNTVVARINGEEILECEVKMEEFIMKNIDAENPMQVNECALYELLIKKAIEQETNTGNHDLEIDEDVIEYALEMDSKDGILAILEMFGIKESEKWLTDEDYLNLYAEVLLRNTGSLEGFYDLVGDMLYNELDLTNEEYLELRESYSEKSQNGTETVDNLIQLSLVFRRELLLSQDIELCLDENKLSTETPKDYITPYKVKIGLKKIPKLINEVIEKMAGEVL